MNMPTMFSALFNEQAVRRAVQRLGLPGAVGVALLLLSAWGEWGSLPAWRAEIVRVEAQTRSVRQAARQRSEAPPQTATPEQVVGALLARLPTPAQRSVVLAGVLEAARAQQLEISSLQLHQADDRIEAGSGAGSAWRVSRQQIDVPLKGRYEQIRAWLVQMLQEQPALSIDHLQLKRLDAQSDQLDARVGLSLWVRDDSRAPAPSTVREARP